MGDCGCEDNGSCGIEANTLPLLTGCPADNEYFLVMNAVGGKGSGKYARRAWVDLKNCVGGGGGGYAALSDTISTPTTDTYTNAALIGATELKFVIINKQLYTYEDGDFSFNENVGTISFLTITLFDGDTITIPYVPA
jgi:hypothetical protein